MKNQSVNKKLQYELVATDPRNNLRRHMFPSTSTDDNTAANTRIKEKEKEERKVLGIDSAGNFSTDETDEVLGDSEEKFVRKSKKLIDSRNVDGRMTIVSQVEGPREALCCKYNEEYDYIAVGYTDGVIRIYQALTGKHVFTLEDDDVKNVRAPCTCIKHRPVSKVYPITNCYTGTYANGCVKCWSYNFNQCLYTIKEKRQTFGLSYHPRFPKFVTYGDDLRVHFYDEETRTQERILVPSEFPDKHDGHMSRIFAACFHPKNNYELITGGWDNVVQFWDLRQPYAIRHISNVHICGEGLDINQKGTEILTCSFQSVDPLQIWDYASGKRIATLEPDIFTAKLYCGKYVSKDFIAMGGADPHLLRIVDLQTTGTAASVNFLPGAVYSLDIGPPKKKVQEKDRKEPEGSRVKSDISTVPKLCFTSTKGLYQVDFY
ncbi:unnamed protein product [Diabrotica balteata]|uniref:Uncharacterized protein n=1 Tax=Diabrotica balteata TaxID=107213 RepID=A0A9P0GVA4_DIABA|nr:unnamed protein product [Diabrotica balteata]